MSDESTAKIELLRQAAVAGKQAITEVRAAKGTNAVERDWCLAVKDAYTNLIGILKDQPD